MPNPDSVWPDLVHRLTPLTGREEEQGAASRMTPPAPRQPECHGRSPELASQLQGALVYSSRLVP